LLETRKAEKIIYLLKYIKVEVQLMVDKMKTCYKCNINKILEEFGKLSSSKDGLRYECNSCRKEYREKNKLVIQQKQKKYYEDNKDFLLEKNKQYRNENIDTINIQRKEYRMKTEIKEHVALKNKEYLPKRKEQIKIKRKTDLNFKISEIIRSKIHKILKNEKTSYLKILGCDLDFFKKWIEFQFVNNMNWSNLGIFWQIDHILPISKFDCSKENEKQICFHWTNLQPLTSNENRSKSDKIELHYYFNNLVNVNRFNKFNKQYLGYQNLNESLSWLRTKLRYGENPSDDYTKVYEIGNQQPRL
jgi:transposase-like protein